MVLNRLGGVIMGSIATGAPLIFGAMNSRHVKQGRFLQIAANLPQQPATIAFAHGFIIDNDQPNASKLEEIEHFTCVKMTFQSPWLFHCRIDNIRELIVVRQQGDDQLARTAGQTHERWCAN